MALDQKVSALTATLKSEFWKAWNEVATPAPWESVTTVLPSTTKIENFLNATPVPGLQRWTGQRNYGQVDTFIYQVRNETWHTEIAAKLEDIEDDQTGILQQQPKFMVDKAKIFPGRMVIKLLGQALGSTIGLQGGNVGNLNAFDGLAFFFNRLITSAGAFGVGNNLISYNGANQDGKTYNLAGMFFGSPVLKPLCWQNRSGPDFRTNSGTEQSQESRLVRWWVDLRGAPFFGYWWNAVGVQINGTPNVSDMHAIYSAMTAAFRTFRYPLTISTEDGEYIHEQTVFDSGNLCIVGSTQLSEQLRQSVSEDWIPQNVGNNTVATTNTFKNFCRWFVSRYMDNF